MPLGSFRLNGISKIITAEGKTVNIVGAGSVAPYGRIGSSYYNQGGSAWLEIAQHPDFAFGTSQDFTMEGWFWFGGTIAGKYFWDGRSDSNSVAVLMDGGYLRAYIAGAYRLSGSENALRPNTWHHVAYTRQGTTGTLWWNGVSQGSWTDTTNYTHSNSIKVLSRFVFTQGSDNSYVDEFRISKVARYTSTFTPNTTGFSSDANTLLLLHLDQNLAPSRTATTITPAGDIRISSGTSKFNRSARLDGSGDYLLVNNSDNKFTFGTNSFTFECWVRFNSSTFGVLFDQKPENTNGFYPALTWFNSTLRYYVNSTDRIISNTLSLNTWYHVALVKSGNDTKLYIDGVQQGSTWTDSNPLLSRSSFIIGAESFAFGTNALNCYIDELRISNTARYTANFTPATSQFTNDSNTLLLLHMDGFANNFYDDINPTTVTDSTGLAYSSPGSGTTPLYPTTLSVRTTATSTSTTITVPSTAQPGDLLVLADMSTTVSSVTPTGWGFWASTSTTGLISNISFKICTQADIGASVTGMAGTTRKVLIVYQGNYEISSAYRSGALGEQATTLTPSNQTISMSGIATPMIAIAVYASTGSVTTRGWSGGTPAEYSSVSTSGIYVKTLIYNVGSTPANATISMSDGGTNVLQSFYAQIY